MLQTFTEADGLLLERGWPHLRVLTDEKVKKPGDAALEQHTKGDSVIGLRFPRAVAHPYLWAQLHPRHSPEAKQAASRTAPFDEAHAPELLDRLFPSMEQYGFHAEDALYLLEALFGTERATGWVVDRLERMGTGAWRSASNPHDRLYVALEALGWMVRRLEAPGPLRARLSTLRAGRKGCHQRYLDVLIDEADGWARVEEKHLKGECCFIAYRMLALSRDGAAVKSLLAGRRVDVWNDPQLAVLAGPESLKAPLASRGLEKAQKVALVERFELISEPSSLGQVALLARSALSKAKLRSWLVQRKAALRPVLEAIVSGDASPQEKKVAADELALI